ncbi:MAG: hypothetical protein SH850_27870 [Planctomycetaceae bacterium]|nr:hypothetical protein [Planctomycetaceae bacterium]
MSDDVTSRPVRSTRRRSPRWLYALLPLLLASGCGLPRWSDLIGAKKTETEPLVVPVQPVQPTNTVTTPPPLPPPSPAEVIAEFQSRPVYELDDGALAALLSLESGLEDVKVLNLNGSKVTNRGLKDVGKLPGLLKLDIRSSTIDENAAQAIAQASSLEELRVDGGEFTDQGVIALRPLQSLRVLVMNQVRLSPEGWAELANHPLLEELWILQSNITDEGMLTLSRCVKLKTVVLNQVPISDAGLAQLSRVEGLEHLNLAGCSISGVAFRGVGGGSNAFMSLQQLHIRQCPLDERGAAIISQMKNLRVMDLGEMPRMQDIGLIKMIKPLKQLEYLDISADTGLTSFALSALVGHEALENLNLIGCAGIDDSGLKHLVKCRNLKKIHLHGTRCTARGAFALKAELPDLEIVGLADQ